MRTSLMALCVVVLAAASGTALAHGPQIQITGETGKIVTRTLLLEAPYGHQLTAEKSVYVMPLREYLGAWYARPNGVIDPVLMIPTYYSGPGIAYGSGYDPMNPTDVDFTPGSVISLGFTAGLQLWNGAAFVDAGATEIEAFRGQFNAPSASARTSDLGPFASLAFPTVSYAAEEDSHATSRFQLLGEGSSPTSASPDGVYLLSLQLTSNQQDMAASDPFFFVLNKNMPLSVAQAAVASLNVDPSRVQVVPEPAAIALGALGLIGVLAAAPRRRVARTT